MATSSITSSVTIKGRKKIRRFIEVLEEAESLSVKEISVSYDFLTGEDIKDFFGEKEGQKGVKVGQ